MTRVELEWPFLVNLAAALGGLAILVAAFGLLNRARGRRFLELPREVGRPELAAFVLLPALLPLIFGGQRRQVAGLIVGNAVLLVLTYLVVGYGLFATLFWALSRMADELAAALGRLVRTLPLLLIFSLVLFVNAEMWQMFGTMPRPFVLVVSQALQVLVVSAGVGAFFIAFGVFAVTPEVGEAWAGTDGAWEYSFDLLGHGVHVTETLLRVAGGMAAFTGLYYAISILTDSTYRDEFMAGVTHEMRGVFEARTEYLTLRG